MNSLGQLDLFEGLDFFQKEQKATEQSHTSVFSPKKEAEMVLFKYVSRMRKSIRCFKRFDSFKLEIWLPSYMKGNDFTEARNLAKSWAYHAIKRKTKKNKEIVKDLVDRFWTLVNQILADRGEKTLEYRGKCPPIKPKGKYHDLNQVLDAINETYFQNTLSCRITWSNRIGGLSFHSIRKDSITGEDFHLISISRGYDAKNCPLYAVAGVVYHECLHIAIPVKIVNGRRIMHSPEFKKRERHYIYFNEWIKWHKEVLPYNIIALRKGKLL